MIYTELEFFLSKARLENFLLACSGNEENAVLLYCYNLNLSQAFYPILNLFEVFFRNALNQKLSKHFRTKDWMIQEQKGFMSNQSLASSKFYLRSQVMRAERNLKRNKKAISTDTLATEQSLSFWVSFFDVHHFKLVSGCVMAIFPHKPTSVNRKNIWKKLQRIRELRNRIYHNEPICFIGSALDLKTVQVVRQDILSLLEWMHPQLPTYIEEFDTVLKELKKIRRLLA